LGVRGTRGGDHTFTGPAAGREGVRREGERERKRKAWGLFFFFDKV
jgi:hypothetical protein